MSFDEFWLQSNNGKKYSLKDLKDIKPEDIAKNPKFKKLIEIFNWDSDGDGKISVKNTQGKNEWESVFADLQQAAVDNDLTSEEFGLYISQKSQNADLKLEDVNELLDTATISTEETAQANEQSIIDILTELGIVQPTMTDAELDKIKSDAYNTVLTIVSKTEKLDKDYENLHLFAKEKLSKSGKQPTLQELVLYAAELQLLNPDIKADKKIKKGTSINLPVKSIDKKKLQLLESKGIKVEKDNYIFFQKLLELDDTKQALALEAIRNSNFKTKEEIINEVYTKTRINLSDTGLTIKVGSVSSTLENFITNTLKVDLSSKEGLKIYDRLCSLGKDVNSIQAVLDSFPKEFINKLSKMNNMTFDKFADKAEVFGIILRTDEEIKDREKNSQVYRDFKARMYIAQYVADNYSSTAMISKEADRNLNFMQGTWWIRHSSRPIAGSSTTDEQQRNSEKVEQIKQLMPDIDTISNEEFSKKMSTIMEAQRTAHSPGAVGAPVAAATFEIKDHSFKFDAKLAYTFMKQTERAELAASVAKRLEPQQQKQKESNKPDIAAVRESTRVYNTQREMAGIEFTVEPLNQEELEQLTEYIKSIKTRKELFLFAKSLHYQKNVTDNSLVTMIPKENQSEVANLLAQRAKALGFAEITSPSEKQTKNPSTLEERKKDLDAVKTVNSNKISVNTFRDIFFKPINKKLQYPKTNEKTIVETYEVTKSKLLGNWDPVGDEIKAQDLEGTIGRVLDVAIMLPITRGMGTMKAFVKIGNLGRNIGTATNVVKTSNVIARFSKNATLINRLAKADKVLGGLWVNGSAGALHGFATMGAYGGLQGTVGMADNTFKNWLEGKNLSDGLAERFEQTLVMGYENAKFGLFAGYSGVLAHALGKGSVALGAKGWDKLFKTHYSKTVLDKVSQVVTEEGISGSKFWAEMHKASKAEGLIGFGYETGFFTLYHKMEEAGVDFNNEESLLTYLQNNLDEETKQSLGATYVSEGGNLAMFKIIGSLIQWVHIGKLSSGATLEIQANNNRALRNMNMRKVIENGRESFLVKFNENDKPIKVVPEQLMQLCEQKMFCADIEDKVQKDGKFKLPSNQTVEYDKAKKVYRTVIDENNTVESASVEELLNQVNQITFKNKIDEQLAKENKIELNDGILLTKTNGKYQIEIALENGEKILVQSEDLNDVIMRAQFVKSVCDAESASVGNTEVVSNTEVKTEQTVEPKETKNIQYNSWEEFEENWKNLPKQFDPIQIEILRAKVHDQNRALIEEDFNILQKLMQVEELSADDIVKLMTSDKIDKSELQNIEEYARIARENGFNLVEVMESKEADFDKYIEETSLKIKHGIPIQAKENWFTETDNKELFFAQMEKFGGYDIKNLKAKMNKLTNEQVKMLSHLMTLTDPNVQRRGYQAFGDIEKFIYIAQNLHPEDMPIFELLRYQDKDSVDWINSKVQNNPAKRAVLLELVKLKKEFDKYCYLNNDSYKEYSFNLFRTNNIYDELENIETTEQAEAYLHYLKSTPLNKMDYYDNPPMDIIKNVEDIKIWVKLDEIKSCYTRSFKKVYLSLKPSDRALMPFEQIKELSERNQKYGFKNDDFDTHRGIIAILNDKDIPDSMKDNLREFLRLNSNAKDLDFKWWLVKLYCQKSPEMGNEAIRRVIELDKTGVSEREDYEEWLRAYNYDYSRFSNETDYFNKFIKALNDTSVQEKLGRKITVKEANIFKSLEGWRREWAFSKFKEGMTEEDTQKIMSEVINPNWNNSVKEKEQLPVADIMVEYNHTIPTTDGEGVKIDYNVYEYLNTKEDIDAFCEFMRSGPYEKEIAKFYINLIRSHKNFAKKKQLVDTNPNISKILISDKNQRHASLERILDEIFEQNNPNQAAQIELLSILDNFVTKHPEFNEKITSFAWFENDSKFNKFSNIDDIKLAQIKKNLEMIDSLPEEDIKIFSELSDYTGSSNDYGFSDVISKYDLSREKYETIKPLYIKNNKATGAHGDGIIHYMIEDNDIELTQKAIKRFETIGELNHFLFEVRYQDKGLTMLLLEDPNFTEEMIREVTSITENCPPRDGEPSYGKTLEQVKELAQNYKKQGLSYKEAYVMMINFESVDINLAKKIVAKSEYEESLKNEYKEDTMLRRAESLAKDVSSENKELISILLENTNFSKERIHTLLHERNSRATSDWNPMKNIDKAIDVARNYERMGLSADEAYTMLLNINVMTPELAKKVRVRNENEPLKRKTVDENCEEFVREYITEENKPFLDLILEDQNFTLQEIKDLVERISSHNLSYSIGKNIDKALEIAKNWQKLGYTKQQTLIMLSNAGTIDINLANKIIEKVTKKEKEKAIVKNRDFNKEKVTNGAIGFARKIYPHTAKLVRTLLDDPNFSIDDIKYLIGSEYSTAEYQIQKALDIAKNYRKNGIAPDVAFVMMLAPEAIDKRLATRILDVCKDEIIERKKDQKNGSENEWTETDIQDLKNLAYELLYDPYSKGDTFTPEKTEILEFLLDNRIDLGLATKDIQHLLIRAENVFELTDLCKNYSKYEMTKKQVVQIIESRGQLSIEGIKRLNRKFGRDAVEKMSDGDRELLSNFIDILDVKNINEITMSGKRKFLRKLVDSKRGEFNVSEEYADRLSMLPKTLDEYCPLLRQIVKSVGIDTEPLIPQERVEAFNQSMKGLSLSVKEIPDKEFSELKIEQEYSREDFILAVKEKIKDLSELEKRKVFDYYGFELHHNRHNTTGYTITGYPHTLSNGEKLAQIANPKTKAVIEALRADVLKFTSNNRIKCNNPAVESLLNEVMDGLPEIRTMIGRVQHCKYSPITDESLATPDVTQSSEYREVNYILNKKLKRQDILNLEIKYENGKIVCNNETLRPALEQLVKRFPHVANSIGVAEIGSHDFDVMQHSLKVMQKIVQDPNFEKLSESDKKIMLLASLLHDITKSEGFPDKTHADESSFDAFYISKKFNLTQEEGIKLFTLIKHHEWLGYVNTQKTEESLTQALQSVAYDLQNDNLFELSLMFTHADLKAVRKDDSFHDKTEGSSRRNFRGEVHSFGEAADIYAARIREYVYELKKTKPLVPTTDLPSASKIKAGVKEIHADGTTDVPGVYIDSDGHVIVKYNELQNEYLERIGFPKGSMVNGIEAVGQKKERDHSITTEHVNTGNIKFFVHGLLYPNEVAKFDAFALPSSDVLLSISYAERPESKWRFFKYQGVIPKFKNKYIHAGGETDAGSGNAKFISEIKENYVFGGHREGDRIYVSKHLKEATGMSDEEYIRFVEADQDKSHVELDQEMSLKINQELSMINSHVRGMGDRYYNEFYGSNPDECLDGTFAYDEAGKPIGNAVEYVNNNMNRLSFLREYDLNNDVAMWLFGN